MNEHVLVAGGGIAGMITALAVAKGGRLVTLLERDPPPPPGDAERAFFEWPRRGACQFRHPHAFLGLMCNLLQDHHPELLEAFLDAGARRLEFRDMLPPRLAARYRPEPGDERLWMLLCRRATIETVLRRHVSEHPDIRLVDGIHIDGVLVASHAAPPTGAPLEVRGLKVRRDCIERFGETIEGDLVIDATGRGSRFPRWLAALGAPVAEEDDDAEIVYYTRHYRLRPGHDEPSRGGEDRASGDLGYLKYGVFPGDNGHFAVIVCVHNDEAALRAAIKDGARFDAICRSIPGLAPWVAEDAAEATTAPFGIGNIHAVWRRYLRDGLPLARNFFAVGDAALRTNPLYGRGCSTGILHAHCLAEVLAGDADPDERARRFDARTETELRPIFEASRREDRSGIRRARAIAEGRTLDEPNSFRRWFSLAFGDALAAATRHDLHVLRGVMRTVNLVEKPGDFLKDRRTQATVCAYMLRGRRRNAAARMQRGPGRDAMIELAAAPADQRAVRP